MAVGVRPEVELARQAGLKLGITGGIRVNARMRTSDASIYAVGDAVEVLDRVTGQPMLLALAGVGGAARTRRGRRHQRPQEQVPRRAGGRPSSGCST